MRLPREIPVLVTDSEMFIPTELIRDKTLSWEARGLLFTLYSTHQPGEAIEPLELLRDIPETTLEDIEKWLQELVKAGHVDGDPR